MAIDRGAAMTAPATGKLILNIGNSGGQFSGPESSLQIRSLADFLITTSESRCFSAHSVTEWRSRPDQPKSGGASLVIRAVWGRRAAGGHTLFRPKLCMHHRGYPNEEGTNETFAYDWLRARRRVLREPGECRRTHGDIEEHQGNRRNYPCLSRVVDSVFLSG